MKITGVTAYPLTQSLATAQTTSQQSYRKVSICLVRIDTDEGIYGVGESLARFGAAGYAKIIEVLLAPIIIGKNPLQIKAIWDALRKTLNGRSGGILFEAIAAIDIALWDLYGKALQQPVYALLGGKIHEKIPAYASSIMVGTNEEEQADRILSLGFNSIKLKISADVQKEIARVKRLRRHVGPDIALMVDVNYAFNEQQALYFAQAVHEDNLLWFEEPIDPDNRRDICASLAAPLSLLLPVNQNLPCVDAPTYFLPARSLTFNLMLRALVELPSPTALQLLLTLFIFNLLLTLVFPAQFVSLLACTLQPQPPI